MNERVESRTGKHERLSSDTGVAFGSFADVLHMNATVCKATQLENDTWRVGKLKYRRSADCTEGSHTALELLLYPLRSRTLLVLRRWNPPLHQLRHLRSLVRRNRGDSPLPWQLQTPTLQGCMNYVSPSGF